MARVTPLGLSHSGSLIMPLGSARPVLAGGECRNLGSSRGALRGVTRPPALQRRVCGFVACRGAAGPPAAGKIASVAQEQLDTPQDEEMSEFRKARLQRKLEKKREEITYQMAAVGATFLVTSMAIVATSCRYHYIMEGQDVNWVEIAASLSLVCGGVAGMEMYARWAHKFIWHDMEAAWALHKSHHEPRTGPFELNDIYAVANAIPAISLCAYGFITPSTPGGICWGLGLGITLYGMMYMFVHDGLVHKRFPVGPIAKVPYLKRVAAAHKMHHIDDFDGLPWGLFLGEKELEGDPKAMEQLERLVGMGDE